MTCSGQFEEQWPRVKQQPKVDRRTRANGRRASTSSPTCALSLSQLTARTARAGSRWHRPSCFPSATCREISRHLSEGHVCEKKGVKKPVNPKNHATADNGRRPLLLCERRPPDLLCVQRPVCRHTLDTHLKSQDSSPRALEERNPTSYGRCHQSSSSCRMGGSLLAAAYLLGKMPEQHRCVWTELPGRDGLGSGGGQHARLLLTFGWLRARWIECES
jgi:hypothetical protein